ncbi:hypothetical protein DFJ74DRAFT_709103 [Hyaloraphidium curvatum]|nr:hypothetical protein DFJ74DRAFT_709103 [Hyaloraphidium curvatum]
MQPSQYAGQSAVALLPPYGAAASAPLPGDGELSLRDKLSRAAVSYLVVALAFCAQTLWNQADAVRRATKSAKTAVLSACNAAESAGDAAVLLPRTAALAINRHLADAITGAIQQYIRVLSAAVDMLRFLLIMVITRYTRLFVCSVDLVVSASVGAMKEYAAVIADWINDQVSIIADELVKGLDAIGVWLQSTESSIKSGFEDFVNRILNFGTQIGVRPVQVNFTTAESMIRFPKVWDGLLRLKAGIPDSAVAAIRNVQIPSLQDIERQFTDLISVPFDMLKREIRRSIGSAAAPQSLVAVPAAPEPLDLCSSVDTSWIDEMGEAALSIIRVAVLVIVGLALASVAYEVAKVSMLHFLASRPGPSSNRLSVALCHGLDGVSRWFSGYFPQMSDQAPGVGRARLRWYLAYVTHVPSLICISAGALGLILSAMEIKFAEDLRTEAIARMRTKSQHLAQQVNDKAGLALATAAGAYETSSNVAIAGLEESFNRNVLGWANDAVRTINATVGSVSDVVVRAVNDGLAPVPWFRTAVADFLRCFLGSQLTALDMLANVMTRNLAMGLPRVNLTGFVQDPLHTAALQNGVEAALFGRASNDSSHGIVGSAVDRFQDTVRSQMVFFSVLLGVGMFVPFMGLVKATTRAART